MQVTVSELRKQIDQAANIADLDRVKKCLFDADLDRAEKAPLWDAYRHRKETLWEQINTLREKRSANKADPEKQKQNAQAFMEKIENCSDPRDLKQIGKDLFEASKYYAFTREDNDAVWAAYNEKKASFNNSAA